MFLLNAALFFLADSPHKILEVFLGHVRRCRPHLHAAGICNTGRIHVRWGGRQLHLHATPLSDRTKMTQKREGQGLILEARHNGGGKHAQEGQFVALL